MLFFGSSELRHSHSLLTYVYTLSQLFLKKSGKILAYLETFLVVSARVVSASVENRVHGSIRTFQVVQLCFQKVQIYLFLVRVLEQILIA